MIMPGMNKIDLVEVFKKKDDVNKAIESFNDKGYKVIDIIVIPQMSEITLDSLSKKDINDPKYVIYFALMNSAEKNRFEIENSSAELLFADKK